MSKNKQTYWYYGATFFLLIFILIASLVATNSEMLSTIDTPIINFVRGRLTTGKTNFFSFFTIFGNTSTVVILTLLLVLALYKSKQKNAAIWLAINVALIQGLGNVGLKLIFNRPRPSVEHLVHAGGYSFPSGHSMGSMLLYGTFIFLLPRLIKHKNIRLISQLLLALLILLVGVSRIYLGVHYPTDVIAGFSMGAAWLCFSYPFFKKNEATQLLEGN